MMFVWGKLSKIWLMKKIWKYVYLVFLELRCFSYMLLSTPKEYIFIMNANAIIIGEHCKTLIWCIYVCVCHWWQHSSKFVKTNRVADYDLCTEDNRLLIYWCTVVNMYKSMYWSWDLVHRTWVDSVWKIFLIQIEQYGNKVLGK